MLDLATAYFLIALNLCLLGPYFVFRFDKNSVEHYFGWVLLIGGIGSALRFYKYSNLVEIFPFLFDFELPIVLLASFAFQKMMVAHDKGFKKIPIVVLALPILAISYYYNFLPFSADLDVFSSYIKAVKLDEQTHYKGFAYAYGGLYLLITFNILRYFYNKQSGVISFQHIDNDEIAFKYNYTSNWLRQYFTYLFVLCIGTLLLSFFVPIYSVFRWVPVLLLPSFWFAFIKIIRSPGFVFVPVEKEVIIEKEVRVEVQMQAAYTDDKLSSAMNEEELEKLTQMVKLIELKLINEKLYLNQGLTVQQLSEKIGLKPYQVSKAINAIAGTNFNDFISKYRVEHAKVLLQDKQQHYLTAEAIGAESGFPSKTTFYDSFKKFTGITPAQYRKEIQSA